jgi:hypothetical protein
MCAWVFANRLCQPPLPTAFANRLWGKPTLPSFSVFPERHSLFCLFYQVEIRYRQLHQNKPSRTAAAASAQLPCNYGNHTVDRLSPGDGSVGSAGGKCGDVGRMQSAGWGC